MAEGKDSRHSFSLDNDGERKGWTCSTSPGNFQVECGSDNVEAQDSLILESKNGNIIIKAHNGKIRLQGTDIELVAVGEGCLLYTSPSPRDRTRSRMPSSA